MSYKHTNETVARELINFPPDLAKLIILKRSVTIMGTFKPVTSNKLYIQIYHQIYHAIMDGTYKVGDKLPSEKEFCAMFNVSRVPVREALCALELNGLVDSMQGVGVYVKQRPVQIDSLWMETLTDAERSRGRDIVHAAMGADEDNRLWKALAELLGEE